MKKYLLALLLSFAAVAVTAKSYTITSPDKKLTLTISAGATLSYNLALGSEKLVDESTIAMTLADGRTLGSNCVVKSAKESAHAMTILSPLYRSSDISVSYTELALRFKGDYGVTFRLYDNGAAYRFETALPGEITITGERAEFNFDKDYSTIIAYSPNKNFSSSFQNIYTKQPLSKFESDNMAMLPLVVEMEHGRKISIAESDLESYPGMFLKSDGKGLQGLFAPVAAQTKIHATRCQEVVETRENYIARCKGSRAFPWRVISVYETDTQMPNHNLIYALASPNRIGSTDWIKPGKVAWDWWNNWGVTGVDFEAGVNTATYMHYIDFAARNNIEYVVLDEGWYNPKKGDMMTVVPEIDLEKLVAYGRDKGVRLILWGVSYSFDTNLEAICAKYSAMGIAGFKIDFFNRDDQSEVQRIYRMADATARHKMLIDYHGIYKPTGMNRTYPNAINFEGVFGLEELKWSTKDMPQYDVTMPYIRMMAGPVDYTQGAMKNANKKNFRDVYDAPMSQGTRSHQIATYVVFDSPLVMLCDSPSAYDKEQQSVDFITSLPTVWDETRILSGTLGEYIVTARRSGAEWYIGGLTNWTARDVEIDLSMLSVGDYNAELMLDGANSHRNGEDYRTERKTVNSSTKLKLRMAPGGGFAMIIKK